MTKVIKMQRIGLTESVWKSLRVEAAELDISLTKLISNLLSFHVDNVRESDALSE